jgi:hypothetical protein
MAEVTPAEARAELARMKGAVDSFSEFMPFVVEGYEEYGYNAVICRELQNVERSVSGEIGPDHPDFCLRLILNMPPQHGKTLHVSDGFPAWCMGRHPKWNFIWAGYNGDRGRMYGEFTKDRVEGGQYKRLFSGMDLKEDTQSKGYWKNVAGGTFLAAGVGTATTGSGAHIIGVDDPLKDREEASSLVRLETIWNWLTSVIRSRLAPRGAIILIETTWVLAGLTHRLINEQPGMHKWKRVKIAAEAGADDILGREEGQFLDVIGSRYEEADYLDAKAFYMKANPKDWQALYQQEPIMDGGNFFKEEWIRRYDKAPDPENVRTYISTDFAGGGGDYTVFGCFQIDHLDNIYVVDWYRSNVADTKAWTDKLLDWVERYGPCPVFFEKGSLAKGVGPFIKEKAAERRRKGRSCYYRDIGIASTKNKEIRAQAVQGIMATGSIYWPNTAWAQTVIYDYLLKFPSPGVADDDVDVLSLLGQGIKHLRGANAPDAQQEKKAYSIDYIEELQGRGMNETFMSTPIFRYETVN